MILSHEPNQTAAMRITTLQTLIWSKKRFWKSDKKRQSCVLHSFNYNPM